MTLTDYEQRYCTPGAQAGILFARMLTDRELLDAARHEDTTARRAWTNRNPDSNPTWFPARCAEEAYDRGLIDEVEFDRLSA